MWRQRLQRRVQEWPSEADILVFRCDQELGQEELDALHDQAMIATGIVRVLVMDKHFEIVVVSDRAAAVVSHDGTVPADRPDRYHVSDDRHGL